MTTLKNILDKNQVTEIYFGCHGFNLIKSNQIDEMQLGYSVHPDGSDLCGTNEGDWFKEWIVIGTDTEVGDPFFVDSNDTNYPVYTAMHGMGSWEPDLVSKTLEAFLEGLIYLQSISNQSYSLIDPNEKTVVDEVQLNSIKTKLIELCGTDDFWEPFFEQYIEWLEESDS